MIALPLNPATGIEDVEEGANGIALFPNPTDGIFTFSLEEVNNDTRFQIVNMQGQVVKASNVRQGNNTVDMTDMPVGFYQLTVFNNEAILSNQKISLVR